MRPAADRPRAGPWEILGWAAALAAGLLVLLPATLELLRARDAEAAAHGRADRAESEAAAAADRLLWLEQDPAADDKLREAEAAAARSKENEHD